MKHEEKTMKKNEKGFGTIEVLLVLVIISLIGWIGWHVWSTRNATPVNNNVDVQQGEDAPVVKEGYEQYENETISLQYPKDWQQFNESDKPEWIFIKSPDYLPATEIGNSVKAGYLLEVSVTESETYESYTEDLKNAAVAQENHGGTYETIKIDGQNAILSNTKTHGTFWHATTYYNGNTYFFRLNALDESQPEVKKLFESILVTVRIK